MNKIILHTGFLFFFISVIFFSQKGMAVEDILLRSLVVFVVFTIMLSVMAIMFVKSVNKAAINKRKSLSENIGRE